MNLNLKNSEFNFVYCIDNNFTKQAMTSLISLLNCINEKINIFIIHHKNCEFSAMLGEPKYQVLKYY